GPRVFKERVSNFIYDNNVIPLKFAVSDSDGQQVEFYECVEDGLSTIESSWLTDPSMPYNGKEFRTIKATTITVDTLAKIYMEPDLIKIDVEGAEWFVFRGMTKKYKTLTFEWTINTIDQHIEQIKYLQDLGYTKIGPQFIEHHLQEPKEWFDIKDQRLDDWVIANKDQWEKKDWKQSNLRPTADVGMCWIK
ncbi:MAG: FkbM family methyltransferase, partial [Minisyncoccia bacterium]